MGTYDNGSYSKDEILQEALQSGIIDFDMLCQRIKDMKRKEIISNHPFSIWQNKEGLWMTYLPDAEKGRVFRKRKTQKYADSLYDGI